MFNWFYATLWVIAGAIAGAFGMGQRDPAGNPRWTHNSGGAVMVNLAIIAGLIYTGFTWGFVFVIYALLEMVVGAVLWGIIRANAG